MTGRRGGGVPCAPRRRLLGWATGALCRDFDGPFFLSDCDLTLSYT